MASSFADHFEGWQAYADKAKNSPPRPLLVEAIEHVAQRGKALDFGAGALTDSRFLLDRGFAFVTALDGEPIAQEAADTLPSDRFAYHIARFEDFRFPRDEYDLVNAQYALPFIRPDAFDRVFDELVASLSPGGILTGQFFGDRDDWSGTPTMSFHTKADALRLLAPLTIIAFRERDDPSGHTLAGKPKHWHYFDIIARRV